MSPGSIRLTLSLSISLVSLDGTLTSSVPFDPPHLSIVDVEPTVSLVTRKYLHSYFYGCLYPTPRVSIPSSQIRLVVHTGFLSQYLLSLPFMSIFPLTSDLISYIVINFVCLLGWKVTELCYLLIKRECFVLLFQKGTVVLRTEVLHKTVGMRKVEQGGDGSSLTEESNVSHLTLSLPSFMWERVVGPRRM